MRISYDFRADMTVCELIQFLSDDLASLRKEVDELIANEEKEEIIMEYIRTENDTKNFIDEICFAASCCKVL